MLKFVCVYEFQTLEGRIATLNELIQMIADQTWPGWFTIWPDNELLAWRYGLVLSDEQFPTDEQIKRIISAAGTAFNTFYPAFIDVSHDNKEAGEAYRSVINQTYGTA